MIMNTYLLVSTSRSDKWTTTVDYLVCQLKEKYLPLRLRETDLLGVSQIFPRATSKVIPGYY